MNGEDYWTYVDVRGGGISNFTWHGGQLDGFNVGMTTTNALSTSRCNRWNITGAQFNAAKGDGITGRPIQWLKPGTGSIDGLTVTGCTFGNNDLGPLIGADTTATLTGNVFTTIEAMPGVIEFNGLGSVIGNISHRNDGSSGIVPLGVKFGGTSNKTRRHAIGNSFEATAQFDEAFR
jgi:hypothetical protein